MIDNQTTTAAGKQEWTPEPWSAECPVSRWRVRGPEGEFAYEWNYGWRLPANVHRTVACVNACAGIADPAAFVAAVRAVVESVEVRLADGAESDEQVHTIDTTALSTLRAELTKLESTKPSEKP